MSPPSAEPFLAAKPLSLAVAVRAPRRRARRLIVAAAADRVRTALEALDDKAIEALCDAVLDGSLDIDEAALRSLELIAEDRR